MDFDAEQLLPPEPVPVVEQPAEPDPFAGIQFGGSAGDIKAEDLSIVQFGPSPSAADTTAADNGAAQGAVTGGLVEAPPQPMVSANGVTDLDSPEPDAKRKRTKKAPKVASASDHTYRSPRVVATPCTTVWTSLRWVRKSRCRCRTDWTSWLVSTPT